MVKNGPWHEKVRIKQNYYIKSYQKIKSYKSAYQAILIRTLETVIQLILRIFIFLSLLIEIPMR